MRNRFQFILPVLDYLGALFWIFGFVLLIPLICRIWCEDSTPASAFVLPAAISLVLGLVLKRRIYFDQLDRRGAMMLCAFGWVGISAIGAIPFSMGLGVSYLDAYFEAVSGFTTTGITMFSDLDLYSKYKSALIWRSMIQWLGGLGILTFFLALISAHGSEHSMYVYGAEQHKIHSKRPAPNLFRTLRILWGIYVGITILGIVALSLEGMGVFDAINHTMTAISTGGYSPYDDSIGWYRNNDHSNFIAIEYTIIGLMLLGGMNFLLHYRIIIGDVRALWDSFEVRLWWAILFIAIVIVAGTRFMGTGWVMVHETIRDAIFQVVSIATTTGFATRDINVDDSHAYAFSALAKQAFLILMVIGGCVGSTGGGFKVIRIGVLIKMFVRQIRQVILGPRAALPLLVDGDVVDVEELRRISALFFAWVALLVIGSGVTALLSNQGAMESASGMFSALGNIGPCYMSVEEMSKLHWLVKVTYIIGMLAGRLEIFPILILFSRRAWR
jgi:trk/ktr system potassium uptake protein